MLGLGGSAGAAAAGKEQAAEALQLTAEDLQKHGIIDVIVKEPVGGAHRKPVEMFETLRSVLEDELRTLTAIHPDTLVKTRREKFTTMGVWTEVNA